MKELKKGQTVYVTKEHPKLQNTPTTGRIHQIGDTHVLLRTTGGTGMYKVHKDNISHDSKDSWMSKKYQKEDAPVNAVGGGNIAGMGVDKPGKPGSGEPGVYLKKKKNVVMAPTMKRKSLTDFIKGK